MYLFENDFRALDSEVPHNINEKQRVTLVVTFSQHYTEWRKLDLFDAVDY